MLPQRAVGRERLRAQVTGKGTLAGVRPHMNLEHRGAKEALFADRARVVPRPRAFSQVAAQMDTQIVDACKHLAAHVALVRILGRWV